MVLSEHHVSAPIILHYTSYIVRILFAIAKNNTIQAQSIKELATTPPPEKKVNPDILMVEDENK